MSKALVPNFKLPHVEQESGDPTYGIVMVVYPKMVPSAYASIRVLRESLLWEMLDQPFKNMFEQESGQLVIDRRRHAVPLELVYFYTFHTPNHFKSLELVHGDKDLFRLAWLKLKSPFYMIQAPPAVAGKGFNNTFCGVTMVQHDTQGEVLFLHRNTRKLTGELKLQNVNLKAAAALRVKEKLLLTPGRRTKPTWEEIEEELRNGPPAPTMDPLEPDGYPDTVYWTHMLSFRSTSKIVHYKIDVHQKLDGFPNGQTCYGLAEMLEENEHFYYQDFANFSFAGLETQLRRYAMEAAQVLRAQQDSTETPAIQVRE
ncbi:hypothetical protein BBJ29_003154 [Phytophthora kernoviae]|uniref:Uncharacterized protein n=1 Tax=Phytophthora kernoviae TaxID=325452 RepID=A0A3F2RPT5_9STRA|nr:hypothetical protein BBJ29_003154 [Phytophthora kernoviae]RLN61910.1 hypothetical protein BBP00_00005111 [Phytophthora kernoviae]